MSLLLRNAAQEHLDNANLNEYHAGINHNKSPVIRGECGKPLFTLHGVTFSRPAPTNREIEIAADLINKFLQRHSTAIDKVMAAQITRHKAETTLTTFKDKYPKFELVSRYPHGTYVKWVTKDNKTTFTAYYSETGKFTITANFTGYVTTTSAKNAISLTNTDSKLAQQLLDLKIALNNERSIEQEATTALDRCEA